MQKEERRKNVDNIYQNLDLVLIAKGKQPYKENPWLNNKGGKVDVKIYLSGISSKTTT